MKELNVKVKFKSDYRAATMIGGQTKNFVFSKGDVVEIPTSIFEWIQRDAPGICSKVTAPKKSASSKKKSDRQVKASANRKG